MLRDALKTNAGDMTVKQLIKKIDNGEMKFDNPAQRGYKYSNTKAKPEKSDVIDSVLIGMDIGRLAFNRLGDKQPYVYDNVDGQQRSRTLYTFVKNEFKLISLDPFDITRIQNEFTKEELRSELIMDDDERNEYVHSHIEEFLEDYPDIETSEDAIKKIILMDLNGSTFEQLPDYFKDIILGTSLKYDYFINASQNIIDRYFVKKNRGRALVESEKNTINARSKTQIRALSENKLFQNIFSEDQLAAGKHRDFSIKAYREVFSDENNRFYYGNTNAAMKEFIAKAIITKDNEVKLNAIFNKIDDIINLINEDEKCVKMYKILTTKIVHMYTLVPALNDILKITDDENIIADWLKQFFVCKKGETTKSLEYNKACKTKCNEHRAGQARYDEMLKDFKEYIKGKNLSSTFFEDLESETQETKETQEVQYDLTEEQVDEVIAKAQQEIDNQETA